MRAIIAFANNVPTEWLEKRPVLLDNAFETMAVALELFASLDLW
jgi:hypothetical protein